MLLVRNSDTPGVIGRVGTALGDAAVNIADMSVGRDGTGEAMMGLSLDMEPDPGVVEAVRRLDGVRAASSIRLD